jgi:hypothetical protein
LNASFNQNAVTNTNTSVSSSLGIAESVSNSTLSTVISAIGQTISTSISAVGNVNRSLLKAISIVVSSTVTLTHIRSKVIKVISTISVSTKHYRTKIISIVTNSAIKLRKSIGKTVKIKSVESFRHTQQLLTNDWSLPNDQEAKDFGESEETDQFVPPTSTTFDYYQENDQDPKDSSKPTLG